MPAHSIEAFYRSLDKGALSSAYYFHGPEDVLKDEAVRALVGKALAPDMRDFNLDQVSAAQVDPEAVHALCNTLPMMAERRVVVLRDVEALKRKTRARAELLRYLRSPSAETLLILVQGSAEEEDRELAHTAYTVRCDPLAPERAAEWVLERAAQLGLQLDSQAAEHLVRSVGADLAGLTSELAKLASLPADVVFTVERVAELVGVRRGETQWDWRSAVLEDETGRAVTLLPAILAQPGMSGVKLLTLLGTALVGLAVTRSLYDTGVRGRSLEDAIRNVLFRNKPQGLLGFREESAQWARLAGRWSDRRIRAALRAALEADQALKSTTLSDERGLLTDLVFRIGARAAEAA